MGNTIRRYAVFCLLTLIAVCTALPLCFAADSPQYILSTYVVDIAGNPVAAVITPSDGEATIYIAVTTQIPSSARVTTSGFSCNADGQPRVNLNSISAPISTVTNANGSTTSVYRLSLMVPDNLASPAASFEFYTTVAVASGETEISETHTATTQLQYTVAVTATPTPTATATAAPTDAATPSPTVPEFPVTAISIFALLATATAGALALKKKQIPL
ncbi:MAG TPA: hypothetical protein VLH35_04550 [Candidatus Acidoferrales bacterium]|nr:hypothetical protein [Candidatus Acidoferrales bacterium]